MFQPDKGADLNVSQSRTIVPDYELPSAMAVALHTFDTQRTLETLAVEMAHHVGVLLIGPDGPDLHAFANGQPVPERFAVVTAEYESPWLRDHGPIAVRSMDGVHQILPRLNHVKRPKDVVLFESLMATPCEQTSLFLHAGNLVRGPNGIAISTNDLLGLNGLTDMAQLDPSARQLGVNHWVVVDAFSDDASKHTDCMVRFLSPTLCAVVRRSDNAKACQTIDFLMGELQQLIPDLRFLEIQAKATGAHFDSPVNWVQLGQTILLPRFGADDPNCQGAADSVAAEGYVPVFIDCATKGLGGGLHCLTASIYAS